LESEGDYPREVEGVSFGRPLASAFDFSNTMLTNLRGLTACREVFPPSTIRSMRKTHAVDFIGEFWWLDVSEKSKNAIPADIKKLSFEDALEELEDIVRTLEEGSGALDDSIKAYERGAMLKKHCEQKLSEARTRVEKIVMGADGDVTSEPADLE